MQRRKLLLGYAAAALLAACQRDPQTPETPTQASADAGRAITDPATIVRQFYDPYLVPDGQIPPLAEAVPWSAHMAADLDAMFARAQTQGEPILDFDPIIDA